MDDYVEYAFPRAHEDHRADRGMTLRDYFAAQAMQATLVATGGWGACNFGTDINCDALADFAYKQAEAMLAAREDQ